MDMDVVQKDLAPLPHPYVDNPFSATYSKPRAGGKKKGKLTQRERDLAELERDPNVRTSTGALYPPVLGSHVHLSPIGPAGMVEMEAGLYTEDYTDPWSKEDGTSNRPHRPTEEEKALGLGTYLKEAAQGVGLEPLPARRTSPRRPPDTRRPNIDTGFR